MKTAAKPLITVLILLLATSSLQASGLVGIYAIVSKVVSTTSKITILYDKSWEARFVNS